MGILISIVATLLLTILNGYFSMSEMALTTAKRAALEHDAEEGDKRASLALDLANDSTNFLATIQVAITLVGFFSATVSSNTLSDPLTKWVSPSVSRRFQRSRPWRRPSSSRSSCPTSRS